MSRRAFNMLRNRKVRHASHKNRPQRMFRSKFEVLEGRRVLATLIVDTNILDHTAFHTISDAIDAAHTGDTIKVAPGTYDGDIDITNKVLTIIGGQQVGHTEIFNGQFVLPAPWPAGPSIINANGSNGFSSTPGFAETIKNFTIENAAIGIVTNNTSGFNIINDAFLDDAVGISLSTSLSSSAKTSTITGNKFSNDGASGPAALEDIVSTGARNVTILNNEFLSPNANAAIAINSNETGTNTSTNVQILDNYLSGDSEIVVSHFTKGVIDGNQILTTTDSQSSSGTPGAIHLSGFVTSTQVESNTLVCTDSNTEFEGIRLDDSAISGVFDGSDANTSDTISGNTITGYEQGMLLNLANKNTVSGNTITHSKADGLAVSGTFTTGNTISSNAINQNGHNGIDVNTATGNTISKNDVSDNGDDGIIFDETILTNMPNKNTVTGNTFNGNQLAGIVLLNATSNTVSGNTVDDNQQEGILLRSNAGNSCTANTVSGNTVEDNGADSTNGPFAGIHLDSANQNTLSSNIVEHNFAQGFFLSSSTGNTLTSNTVEFNAESCFELDNGSGNTLKSNTAEFETWGIFLDDSNGNTITSNIASHNSEDGIEVNGSNQNSFTSNTVNSNLTGGFFALNSNTNTYTKNTANNNFRGGGGDGDGFELLGNTNTLTSNTANSNAGSGIVLDGTGNTVKTNTANNNLLNGFEFLDSNTSGNTADTITGNIADNNGLTLQPGQAEGFQLQDITNSTVSGNTAKNNYGSGIEATSNTAGNTITKNTASGNGDEFTGFDIIDFSSGSGTAGTANTWTSNTATTRNPSGLL